MKPVRVSLVLAIIIPAVFALSRAIDAGVPDRPAGVDPTDWSRISDSLGFVVVPQKPVPARLGDRTTLIAPPIPLVRALIGPESVGPEPVEGYFMVKRGGIWRRLIVVDSDEESGFR
jgi:hypothetical protein